MQCSSGQTLGLDSSHSNAVADRVHALMAAALPDGSDPQQDSAPWHRKICSWMMRSGSKFPRYNFSLTFVDSAGTSPIGGGPTLQPTGPKGSATVTLVPGTTGQPYKLLWLCLNGFSRYDPQWVLYWWDLFLALPLIQLDLVLENLEVRVRLWAHCLVPRVISEQFWHCACLYCPLYLVCHSVWLGDSCHKRLYECQDDC